LRQYDFEEKRVKQEIAKHGAKRVLLQLPEGLKPEAPRLAELIEKAGALPIISADPCYGACDLATADAESLDADLIVHYGHSKLVKHERIPTVYVEARATMPVESAVESALPLLKCWRKIGLVTTVQHLQTLDAVKKLLRGSRKTVLVGDAGHLSYAGQVIGCDYSNAKVIAKDVEAFLFVGGGQFHALGVTLSTSKPTIVADPYGGNAFSVEKEAVRVLKQRWASIQEAKRGKDFGVIVGLKQGQKRLDEALQVKQKLETKGKNVCLLAAHEITLEALMQFPTLDAYVNTACPRISLDDASRFKKPVLTVNEALVVVEELSWEELCRKGLLEN
jgi:2-(3-amino-3-carboxypropyl)histidine synthase